MPDGSMTSRERVLAAFAFEEPDRVPAWFGAAPETRESLIEHLGLKDDEALSVRLGDDFRRVHATYAGPVEFGPDADLAPGSTYRTPFGVERHGYGYGMPRSNPLAGATIDEVHAYPWPDPAWMSVSGIRTEIEAWGGRYAILGGDWSPFWHDAIDLLDMEPLVLMMYEDPKLVDALLEHIVDYYIGVSRRIFDAAGDLMDISFIGNDFGSMNGPLMSEAMFRRFFLPHLKRLVDLGHDYGLKVMMHCCGGFVPLMPAMIEIGLDGLQALQPSARGMDPVRAQGRLRRPDRAERRHRYPVRPDPGHARLGEEQDPGGPGHHDARRRLHRLAQPRLRPARDAGREHPRVVRHRSRARTVLSVIPAGR